MPHTESDDETFRGLTIEDLAHLPGVVADHHLPERNRDALDASHDLKATIADLVHDHNVRVILSSDFSSVSVAVVSNSFGLAEPEDLKDLAAAALKILAVGGFQVALYSRHMFSDAGLVVTPVEGKAPRTDVTLEDCLHSLSGES